MVDLKENNFVCEELSQAFLNNFLKIEKFKNACLKYSNSKVDVDMMSSFIEHFVDDIFDLEHSIYAYFWLMSKKQCSKNIYLQSHYKKNISGWFDAFLNNEAYTDFTSGGYNAFDVYTSGEDYPFNIHLNRVYSYSSIIFLLNEFGENVIPDRIIKLLNKNESDCEDNYEFIDSCEFNELIYEDLIENETIECDIFSTYVPNSLSYYSVNLLAECSGLLYSKSTINLGCILFESRSLSNFLKTADISAVNELLDIISVLIGYIDVGMASISEPRVISKDSPLWEFYKVYSVDDSIEYIIISSYFLYDVGKAFDLNYFRINELEELDEINKQISNLLKL